jgi:hypothetical protein
MRSIFAKFPVLFPVSRENASGDWSEWDCLRHQTLPLQTPDKLDPGGDDAFPAMRPGSPPRFQRKPKSHWVRGGALPSYASGTEPLPMTTFLDLVKSTLPVVGAAFAAAAGWVILEFVGRPLRRFYDMRGEAIVLLIDYANLRARYREIEDDVGATSGKIVDLDVDVDEIKRLDEGQKVYRNLAPRLRAFAVTETSARWIVIRVLHQDPSAASKGLIGISNSLHEENRRRQSRFHRQMLIDALKIDADLIDA